MIDWDAVSAADVIAFADTIAGVARELTRSVPHPRGAPLFGLDMSIVDPFWLDRFSRHGIFRKYQRAVTFDAGFGGVARWWAALFGCRVLVADPHPGLGEAAERLGAGRLVGRVTFRRAPAHNLPLPAEQFTHAWSVDGLAALADPAPALREALRVLRPAGMLCAIVPGRDAEDPAVGRWLAAVDAAGFIAAAVRRLPPTETPFTVHHAEHVLRAALRAAFTGERRERLLALAEQLDRARSSRTPRVMVFAEKPS